MDDFLYAVYEAAIEDIDLTKYNHLTRPQIWWDIKGLALSIRLQHHTYTNTELQLINNLEELVDAKLGIK